MPNDVDVYTRQFLRVRERILHPWRMPHLQFSLRDILIVMTLGCVGLAAFPTSDPHFVEAVAVAAAKLLIVLACILVVSVLLGSTEFFFIESGITAFVLFTQSWFSRASCCYVRCDSPLDFCHDLGFMMFLMIGTSVPLLVLLFVFDQPKRRRARCSARSK